MLNYIPGLIMLLAGLITCIVGIIDKFETVFLLKSLLYVLIIFYFFGLIIKKVIAKIIDNNSILEAKEIEATNEEN